MLWLSRVLIHFRRSPVQAVYWRQLYFSGAQAALLCMVAGACAAARYFTGRSPDHSALDETLTNVNKVAQETDMRKTLDDANRMINNAKKRSRTCSNAGPSRQQVI